MRRQGGWHVDVDFFQGAIIFAVQRLWDYALFSEVVATSNATSEDVILLFKLDRVSGVTVEGVLT